MVLWSCRWVRELIDNGCADSNRWLPEGSGHSTAGYLRTGWNACIVLRIALAGGMPRSNRRRRNVLCQLSYPRGFTHGLAGLEPAHHSPRSSRYLRTGTPPARSRLTMRLPGRIRTCAAVGRSHALCPLSYGEPNTKKPPMTTVVIRRLRPGKIFRSCAVCARGGYAARWTDDGHCPTVRR